MDEHAKMTETIPDAMPPALAEPVPAIIGREHADGYVIIGAIPDGPDAWCVVGRAGSGLAPFAAWRMFTTADGGIVDREIRAGIFTVEGAIMTMLDLAGYEIAASLHVGRGRDGAR